MVNFGATIYPSNSFNFIVTIQRNFCQPYKNRKRQTSKTYVESECLAGSTVMPWSSIIVIREWTPEGKTNTITELQQQPLANSVRAELEKISGGGVLSRQRSGACLARPPVAAAELS